MLPNISTSTIRESPLNSGSQIIHIETNGNQIVLQLLG